MKIKHTGLLAFWLFWHLLAAAQSSYSISAPGGRMRLQVQVDNAATLRYSLWFGAKHVIRDAPLGLVLARPSVSLDRFTCTGVDSSVVNETWRPLYGEQDQITNHYRQLTLQLADAKNSGIRLSIQFRLYDDGLGFRYLFPEQKALQHFVVAAEQSRFVVTGNHKAFWIPGDYDTNEYSYTTSLLDQIDAAAAVSKEKDIALQSPIGPRSVQTPLLLQTADGLFINIHEAALRNYPVMHLVMDSTARVFTSQLTPDAVGNAAYLQTPAQTPWRTVMVTDNAPGILMSNLIVNLNEPAIDTSYAWVKPQKYMGMWWEMHTGKANWALAGGKHGANTANVKQYIDFAARHKFDGVLVEGWNKGWEDWFGNWKEDVFDFVTPYPDYRVDSLSAYAKAKGVRLIMHHETSGSVTNYERHMDTAYRFMQRYGMNTVKTGYVGRIIPRGEHHDGQWMVNHLERVARKAAAHQLMVVAHESVHPTGLHRTFPNWMANEAARGSEFHNAPTLGMTPEHTTILPFTRGVGGPMDFTPGFFHFSLNQFDSSRTQRVRSTLAKQLALYVTMYSPVQMAADLPQNYEVHPDAFRFITEVPVDWSESKVLAASPGDFIVTARRKKGTGTEGQKWYLGAITDEEARTLRVAFDFLPAGKKFQATIYADAPAASWQHNPEAYRISTQKVDSKTVLNLKLAPGGGCAISMVPL